jgi:putative membrane protein
VSDADKRRLADIIRAIEASSRAEILWAVSARSGSYERGPATAAGFTCSAILSFLLFSPWEFSLPVIAVAPVAAAALVGLAGATIPALVRLLSDRATRRTAVERAARAAFVERGVSHTRERTGILVYVSRLEREVVVVADKGVTDVVAPDRWRATIAPLERAVADDEGIEAMAAALDTLGALLARELPVRADDTNELPDIAEAAS